MWTPAYLGLVGHLLPWPLTECLAKQSLHGPGTSLVSAQGGRHRVPMPRSQTPEVLSANP